MSSCTQWHQILSANTTGHNTCLGAQARTEGKSRKVESHDRMKARDHHRAQMGSRKGSAKHDTMIRVCQQQDDDECAASWGGSSSAGCAAVTDTDRLLPALLPVL